MLKAIIFDFDGIIAHTEPVHLKAFQLTLSPRGIELGEEEYYEKYLAYDDKTLFKVLFNDRGIGQEEHSLDELMMAKSSHYDKLISGNIELLPGAKEFVEAASESYVLAIGSGALEKEVRQVLRHADIESLFKVIVGADFIEKSKPSPDVYLEALSGLNAEYQGTDIRADNCLVIEDSMAGIEAALSAGMKCLAITNSYPEDKLSRADLVKDSLRGLRLKELESLF